MSSKTEIKPYTIERTAVREKSVVEEEFASAKDAAAAAEYVAPTPASLTQERV